MKKSLLLSISSLCFSLVMVAQPKLLRISDEWVNIRQPHGIWTFYLYPGNIIGATYVPDGSERDEQVSDAVIAPRMKRKAVCTSSKENMTVTWGNTNAEISDEQIRFRLDNGSQVTLLNGFYSAAERGFRFSLTPDEKIFGTGERSLPMNRRGYKLPLMNNPWYGYSLNADALNYSVPIVISSNQYAIFFDNPSVGYIDIGKTNPGEMVFSASSGRQSFYIVPGKDYSDILSRYHQLVGTQPLPPRWAMGNFMSRFGYFSEKQVTEIMDRMKSDSIPFDAVIFDLFWFGDSIKNTLGNLDWVNRKAWPDPEKMIRNWKKKNIQTILITEPFVLQSSGNYEESKPYLATDSSGRPFQLTDFYFGLGGLIDIFQRQAGDWFYSKYKKQIDIGVEGWWGDLGEPEKHPDGILHNLESRGYFRKYAAREVHNIYGHQWSRMLFENYQKDYPRKRLFHLNRSGFAGTPRFSSFPWSGDVSRSWDGMKAQIPLMLGMGMSGIPYIHADAGGFAGGEGDAELYVRWLQFAAFTPIFRPHGTALGQIEPTVKDIPSEAALWPEPTKSLARKAVNTRYEWLPYNYTLSYEQTKNGKPLATPLFFLNKADSNLYKAADQYLWGEQVMVVPVTEPGLKQKNCYIPSGKWTRMQDGKTISGPAWITDSSLTLEYMPVWIKEGSFIPTVSNMRNTSEYFNKDLVVTYYPSSKPSRYTLYEDDGSDALSLKNKQYELTYFSSTGKSKSLDIEIRSNGGRYPGRKDVRMMHIRIPTEQQVKSVSVNGITVKKNSGWSLEGAVLDIPIAYKHRTVNIRIQY